MSGLGENLGGTRPAPDVTLPVGLDSKLAEVQGLLLRLAQWSKCLGPESLGSFFLQLFTSKALDFNKVPNVLEKATVTMLDDEILITIRVPFRKEDLLGHDGMDYVRSPTMNHLVHFASLDWRVEAVDEVVRTVGTAMGLVMKKVNPGTKLHVSEDDVERALECFPWLKDDVKAILQRIEKKYQRGSCTRKRCTLLTEGR